MRDQQVRLMNTKQSYAYATIAVAMIASLALLSLTPARPAKASGNGYHFAKWLVTLNFPNNKPRVELTTQIWYQPVNGPAQLAIAQTDALACTVTGALQITNETATFSGQEHITCQQPDMVQKIYLVSNGLLNVSPVQTVFDPFALGVIMVSANAPAKVVLPVHHHPNIQYGLASGANGLATQHFRVDTGHSRSVVYMQSTPHNIRADFRRQANGNYNAGFTMNGVTAPGIPSTINGPLLVNLAATTIYFGYSPLNNTHFQGEITTATVDPGVIGRD
ncbi:MAG: hypothetical protein ACK47M_01300 [Caldilinea sp.]